MCRRAVEFSRGDFSVVEKRGKRPVNPEEKLLIISSPSQFIKNSVFYLSIQGSKATNPKAKKENGVGTAKPGGIKFFPDVIELATAFVFPGKPAWLWSSGEEFLRNKEFNDLKLK